MKKKLLALSLIVICLATAVGGSLAYYSARGTAHNIITSGNINIEVVEKQKNADGVLVDYPKEPITGVMPGASVSKLVSVKNTGSGDAWIRVSLGVKVELDPNATEKLPEGAQPDLTLFKLNTTTGKWAKDQDSQTWYYTEPVAPNQSTEALLESVSFEPRMGNAYQGCTVHVLVNAEAVQVRNNGADYTEATGWPGADTVLNTRPNLPEPNPNAPMPMPTPETEDENGNPDDTVSKDTPQAIS